MFIDISDKRGRTEELQRMLRYLSFAYGDDRLRVNISGVYDEATRYAVTLFQQISGLVQTGRADLNTWDAVVTAYGEETRIRAPIYIYAVPNDADYVSSFGERSDAVMLLQVVLGALRQNYDYGAVPLSGVYGAETEEAIKQFQRANRIPETGQTDRETWQRLAVEYNNLIPQ